jgi:hypothetical protein
MIRFINKLFSSKQQSEASSTEQTSEPTPAARKQPVRISTRTDNGAAFYLDTDEAKTLGNLDYMRSSKSVRRTFPKAKLGQDNELVRKISAMEAERLGIIPGTTPVASQPTAPSAAAEQTTSARRTADSSLDLFRSMAREIKKG